MDFTKGHGTQNDFVVLPDSQVRLDLTPARVEALCDRRRGLGADGVLRVARTGALLDAGVLGSEILDDALGRDDWFMDYRNADGSIAEMCGNGVRVFAHYLRTRGLEDRDEFIVGSRAGARAVTVHTGVSEVDAEVTVAMGPASLLGGSSVQLDGHAFAGIGVDVGNPHLACVVPGLDAAGLAALDVAAAPEFDRGMFPHGVNVEILTPIRDGAVSMRVHERGVGETRSCGTGTVAAAVAALQAEGHTDGSVRVRVPGGVVDVRVESGSTSLRGPSVLLASGAIDDRWWARLG